MNMRGAWGILRRFNNYWMPTPCSIFGSDDPGYTASKIYPYILAEKPLLAIFHEESSVVRILQETNAGTVVTFKTGESVEEVARASKRNVVRPHAIDHTRNRLEGLRALHCRIHDPACLRSLRLRGRRSEDGEANCESEKRKAEIVMGRARWISVLRPPLSAFSNFSFSLSPTLQPVVSAVCASPQAFRFPLS